MNPKLMLTESFSILALLFVLAGRKPALAQTPAMEDCEPKSCGDGRNITYPFWLDGEQQSYCGYSSFKVTCKNNSYTPVTTFIDREFYLIDIFYDNRSLILTSVEFLDQQCPLPYANLTTNTTFYPLSVSPLNTEVYFLLNCSDHNNLTENGVIPIDCQSTAYFGGEYDSNRFRSQRDFADAGCTLYIEPAHNYSRGDSFNETLSKGWLLSWSAVDCDPCLQSGGRCGFNESTAKFMCICADGVHVNTCGRSHNRRLQIVIGVLGASGVVSALLCGCFLYKKHKKRSKYLIQDAIFKPHLKDSDIDSARLQTHLFSYDELLQATNRFNAANELGDGGFCTVYKGTLQDGRTIAVKRLYENNCRRLEQFVNEIEILSRLRHQNLVSLYGCSSPHSQGLLLVYEFVPNGTVADHLHGHRANEGILTWPMRLNIAIEAADALAYLHAVNPPIIHRDVKTCNILLDSNFHVKVADFGLSRLFPKDVTHVSTAPQGTPGYMDPEYHQYYQLTNKSDVYSFGVVLVELISSKPAVDMGRNRSEINLSSMAVTKIQNGDLEQLVDARLYQSDQATRKMMTMAAEVAFRCLQTDGDMRPSIKEVLDSLRTIEMEGRRLEKKIGDDDAELLKNVAPMSPDTVMNKWASNSTTPSTSQ
ncbi:LEAF RUST 10 DISEASE-RESISTANCE LOCUS RECEPTOR-LIKE PROTEIN KINASE-like 1.2 [Zingiber officinale]|uniref:Protein kinase domain-containing protein n=1 Tax=Zingiber officinale TaxID=94328 RepID=A0A8J5L9U6_ZINOF|nr:LEAF RUST 10 DISEASE-RESISTANCE LOCUS RECEPTOR-LIKE PROTEIN KINASE-like 1.2 [Zingiber officinale]KAG6510974.1 hypothetical protein ZIOFF_029022 [Zingiber officinale]